MTSLTDLHTVIADYTRRTGKSATVDGLLSSLVRSCFTAGPDQTLLVIDYAQIEARYVNWIAGQRDALERFNLYDTASKQDKPKYDPYRALAGVIYGVEPETISKDGPQRAVGKEGELGGGFGMGRAKFGLRCALQGIDLAAAGTTPKAVIDAYRNTHPKVKRLWKDFGVAAVQVVAGETEEAFVGRSYLRMQQTRSGRHLTIRLPSGRLLWYRDAKIEDLVPGYCAMYGLPEVAKPTVTYMDRNKGRISTYGAKLVENVTQAGARDILAQSMLRLDAAGLPTTMTVHDEWLGEVPVVGAGADLRRAETIMAEVPEWAAGVAGEAGLPIAVEGFTSKRYRK